MLFFPLLELFGSLWKSILIKKIFAALTSLFTCYAGFPVSTGKMVKSNSRQGNHSEFENFGRIQGKHGEFQNLKEPCPDKKIEAEKTA